MLFMTCDGAFSLKIFVCYITSRFVCYKYLITFACRHLLAFLVLPFVLRKNVRNFVAYSKRCNS